MNISSHARVLFKLILILILTNLIESNLLKSKLNFTTETNYVSSEVYTKDPNALLQFRSTFKKEFLNSPNSFYYIKQIANRQRYFNSRISNENIEISVGRISNTEYLIRINRTATSPVLDQLIIRWLSISILFWSTNSFQQALTVYYHPVTLNTNLKQNKQISEISNKNTSDVFCSINRLLFKILSGYQSYLKYDCSVNQNAKNIQVLVQLFQNQNILNSQPITINVSVLAIRDIGIIVRKQTVMPGDYQRIDQLSSIQINKQYQILLGRFN